MAEGKTIRRPIKTRDTAWASKIAAILANLNVSPNTISLMSVVFALLSGFCFVLSSPFELWKKSLLLFLGAGFIQLRLLCNLFDGMVAIEGGKKSKSGEVFNDFPDRLADPLILVGVGYAMKALPFSIELGWMAGILAVMTAYIRYLGVATGAGVFFGGPMAKQHRMAVATTASVLQGILCFWGHPLYILYAGTLIIILGCIITVFKRVIQIIRNLEQS